MESRRSDCSLCGGFGWIWTPTSGFGDFSHTICQHFKLKAKFATMSFSSFSNPRSRIQNQKLPVNINHLLVASQNLLVDRISSNVSRSQLTKSRSPRAPKRRNVSSRRRSGSSVGWGARVLRVLMGLLRHVGPPGETGNS